MKRRPRRAGTSAQHQAELKAIVESIRFER